jgi:hypothetical protein
MGHPPNPNAVKKRAKERQGKHPIWDTLLRPMTWKTMLMILKAIDGIIRLGAKIGNLLS